MKVKHYHYARKLRQLRHLARKVERYGEREPHLVRKLRQLYERLQPVISGVRLRKALAGAAIFLGLGAANSLSAQNPVFAPPVQNPFNFQAIDEFNVTRFVDIDNDGDLDIFSSGYNYDAGDYWSLKFFENVGTASEPEFAEPIPGADLGIDLPYIITSVFADLDNDGDQDMLVNTLDYDNYSGAVSYIENIGDAENPVWDEPVLEPFGITAPYSFAFYDLVDMDNDGDFDLMSSEYYGSLVYYENIGDAETPLFEEGLMDPFGLVNPLPYAIARLADFVDFDADGDPDVFMNTYDYGDSGQPTFYYIENIGTPESPDFAEALANPFDIETSNTYAFVPQVVDIDDDGDLDIFASYYYNGGMYFYENLGVNSLPTSADVDLQVNENDMYAFDGSEFTIDDADGDELAGIRLISVPDVGELTLDGNPTFMFQEIDVADLNTLVYTPPADVFGEDLDSFEFQVFDGIQYSVLVYNVTFDVLESVGTKEANLDGQLSILPNPVKTSLNIQIDLETPANNLQVSIFSSSGILIQEKQYGQVGQQWSAQLSTADLAPGMYLLKINADGYTQTLRFVKQ